MITAPLIEEGFNPWSLSYRDRRCDEVLDVDIGRTSSLSAKSSINDFDLVLASRKPCPGQFRFLCSLFIRAASAVIAEVTGGTVMQRRGVARLSATGDNEGYA